MMKTMDAGTEQWAVSLVRGDLLFRLQRKVGLIPEQGLGIVRRALFWSMLSWLPTAIWAWQAGYLLPSEGNEPLLAHFAINVRLLLAVPLFIIAEGMVQGTLSALIPRFVSSGVVPPEKLDSLRSTLTDIAKLRDSTLPWVALCAVLVTFFFLSSSPEVPHELVWVADSSASAGLGFGAWWYLYVGRTIFLTLLFAWLWRLALLFILFKRIAGLQLSLVPTHPDRCAGLGFMAKVPVMFAPVVLGVSSVFASGWAHQLAYHQATLLTLKIEIIAVVVLIPLIFLMPFISFLGLMLKTKKQGLMEYGDLIAHHGRLVRERWIEGKPVADEPILDAPELGPIADTAAPYELIAKMRPLPLTMASFAPLLAASVLPMIVLAAMEFPIKTVLKAVRKALG